MKMIRICDVDIGKHIWISGDEYIVLDKNYDNKSNVFCLKNDIVDGKFFSIYGLERDKNGDRIFTNNIGKSNVFEFLRQYSQKYHNNIPYLMDLKDSIGQREYGKILTPIGLLSVDEFEKYFYLIPKTQETYWLCTPYSTPKYEFSKRFFPKMMVVSGTSLYIAKDKKEYRKCGAFPVEGSVYYNDCDSFRAIRPTILIDKNAYVDVKG